MRRHQCADAAMKVYGLSPRQSRQLYDLTLLEIRRTLWDETKHSPVTRAQLGRSKNRWVTRFANFLTPEEFTKFAVLMRGLPPSLVVLVKFCNEGKIRAGAWPALRENLRLVLEGDPQNERWELRCFMLFPTIGRANLNNSPKSAFPQE